MGLLNRIIDFFVCRRWRYAINSSVVRVQRSAKFVIGKDVSICNSTVFVDKQSSLVIKDGVIIDNADIFVRGSLIIDSHTVIGQGKIKKTAITIEDGFMRVGHHSKLSCDRIWIRFGGEVSIGSYTNYNAGGEIRSDEAVSIGNYGMISYNVNIWDTNTHTIYPPQKRREMAERYWPYFGKEIERPKTIPIRIGNDAWIGENVSILKGTEIGDGVIVGYGTTLVNKKIESGSSVVTEPIIKYI